MNYPRESGFKFWAEQFLTKLLTPDQIMDCHNPFYLRIEGLNKQKNINK